MEQQIKPKTNWMTHVGNILSLLFLILAVIRSINNFSLVALIVYIFLILVALGIAGTGDIKTQNEFYRILIFQQNIRSIKEIAQITKSNTERVKRSLNRMLQENILPNVGVNYETEEIRIFTTQLEANEFTTPYEEDSDDSKETNQKKGMTYICSDCGARSSNNQKSCEYCGGRSFTERIQDI